MSCPLSSADLACPLCESIFSDPVTLGCGHSFCWSCIVGAPSPLCTMCRAPLPPERDSLVINHVLKSLSLRAKERPLAPTEKQTLCPDHEEPLKLFCVTDQTLACIICRDGEAHDGHKFKPIREAAASLRRDLDLGLANQDSELQKIQQLHEEQSTELSRTKEGCGEERRRIYTQTERLIQALQKKRDQLLHQETEPEKFLRLWSERQRGSVSTDVFSVRSEGLSVVPAPLLLGPQHSHLQFFMWKQLLQTVEPRPDLLTLPDQNPDLTVSEDGRSFHCTPFSGKQYKGSSWTMHGVNTRYNFTTCTVPQTLSLSSVQSFSSGQHYWEVEVGLRRCWCVGVTAHLLKYENDQYFWCRFEECEQASVSGAVRVVGVYLDCDTRSVSFYEARSMSLLLELRGPSMLLPVNACFHVTAIEPDINPLTICQY
uniref:Uncharacterized protein n=1 Tax=Knipowitschia caucasica TaxID=637954 RepID=A0AAV2M1L3_KNICA